MSQYLNSRLKNSYLPPFGNNEGQMVPSVRPIMRADHWNSDSEFDWDFIKSEWNNLAVKSGKNLFIEASPPNMARVSSILKAFPSCAYVFSISSPYSFIASNAFSYNKHNLSFSKIIQMMTHRWIERARTQKANINSFGVNSNFLTYEEFCLNPDLLLEKFQLEKQDASHHYVTLAGKQNSRISEIVDMSPKHLSFLGTSGVLQVNEILSQETSLLDFFGYKIMSLNECSAILSQNLLLSFDGMNRRGSLRKD